MFFYNQLLVLQPWTEELSWKDKSFRSYPLRIRVWNIPQHWLSIEIGKKIGSLVGTTLDVLLGDVGSREVMYIKILAETDLSKPLIRGTKLKYKMREIWVEFRYEQLPFFCYYCSCIGHNKRICAVRKEDLE